jgi:hypothetical protein
MDYEVGDREPRRGAAMGLSAAADHTVKWNRDQTPMPLALG